VKASEAKWRRKAEIGIEKHHGGSSKLAWRHGGGMKYQCSKRRRLAYRREESGENERRPTRWRKAFAGSSAIMISGAGVISNIDQWRRNRGYQNQLSTASAKMAWRQRRQQRK
jgi:hypothetical protein